MNNDFLLCGDCVLVLKELEDNSVDSVVCDPPYELGFMGKKWDSTGIAYDKELWGEVLRLMKPGAHLLAFGGTRTYHRMACAIEDAGFEIRDQLQWLYGSGFPKSYNIGKGVDKLQGIQREIIGYKEPFGREGRNTKPTGKYNAGVGSNYIKNKRDLRPIYKDCNEWEGWGSALKPANEPIVLARKPLSEKTIVENVLKWGVGGLNIGASRIGSEILPKAISSPTAGGNRIKQIVNGMVTPERIGRFPGNVLLDEVSASMLDEQSGIVSQGHWSKTKTTGFGEFGNGKSEYFGVGAKDKTKSGASRFFYCAKASKSERNKGLEGFEFKIRNDGRDESLASGDMPHNRSNNLKQNHHPTVKPVKLMEYLVRLVTPKNGVVLDPFMGSGTTGLACKNLGFKFIGIEKEKDYFDIAKARIENKGVN